MMKHVRSNLALAALVCLWGGVESLAVEPLRIMPLGDSITCGLIGPAPGFIPGGYRTKLWQDLTGAGLSIDFVGSSTENPDSGNLPDANHNGYGGWTVSQINAKISDWLVAAKPAVVLLHIGTNDMLGSDPVETVGERLDTLITNITTRSPQTHLIVAKIINSSDPHTGERVGAFNGLVSDIVGRHANNVERKELVTLVDMNAVVPYYNLSDPWHPTKAGYDQMGDAWFGAIQALGSISNPVDVPEPSTAVSSLLGMLGVAAYAWRQRGRHRGLIRDGVV